MFTRTQILTALRKVIHPEKGKDIVTLGMVTGIDSGENGISLIIEPEKSNDPFICINKKYNCKNFERRLWALKW